MRRSLDYALTYNLHIRVITATHQDLYANVREGLFREDLYYRLKVFPIQLPTLMQRREDIPLLADHFIQLMSQKTGKYISGLSPSAQHRFMKIVYTEHRPLKGCRPPRRAGTESGPAIEDRE